MTGKELSLVLERVQVPPEVRQRYQEKLKRERATAEVFQNEKLLEKIVGHVIFSLEDPEEWLVSEACNLRFVGYSWFKAVSDCLRNRKEGLIDLNLEDSDEGSVNLLKKLVELLKNRPGRLNEVVPLLELDLPPILFSSPNLPLLTTLLTDFGEGLCYLALRLPTNGAEIYLLPGLNLPVLRELRVTYDSSWEVNYHPRNVVDTTAPTIHFIQAILQGAGNLVKFTGTTNSLETRLPLDFEKLNVPESVTELRLGVFQNAEALGELENYHLPNLKLLLLRLGPEPSDTETVYRILKKFRLTLKTLQITGCRKAEEKLGELTNPTLVRFPVMTKLEELLVVDSNIVQLLMPGQKNLTNLFPKLKNVHLAAQSFKELTKWIGGSVYSKVGQLNLSLLDGEGDKKGTVTRKVMAEVKLAFRNVTELQVQIYGKEKSGLKFIFEDMTKLKKLTLVVLKDRSEDGSMTCQEWDSVFTGFSEKRVVDLEKDRNRKEWTSVVLKNDPKRPSIRRLIDLEFLCLYQEARAPLPLGPLKNHPDSISDVTFQFALLKMAKLTKLRLFGTFRTSKLMTRRWKQEKGTEIQYIPSWFRRNPDDLMGID